MINIYLGFTGDGDGKGFGGGEWYCKALPSMLVEILVASPL